MLNFTKTVFTANTDFRFLWEPHAAVTIDKNTATVHISHRLYSQYRYNYNFSKIFFPLAEGITNLIGEMNPIKDVNFNEVNLKHALLCLTGYPLVLTRPSMNPSIRFSSPNPWKLIDEFANVDIEVLVSLFRSQFPEINIICCNPHDCHVTSTFSKSSPLIISLARAGIKVLTKEVGPFGEKKGEFVLTDTEISPVETIQGTSENKPGNRQIRHHQLNEIPEDLLNGAQAVMAILSNRVKNNKLLLEEVSTQRNVALVPFHDSQLTPADYLQSPVFEETKENFFDPAPKPRSSLN